MDIRAPDKKSNDYLCICVPRFILIRRSRCLKHIQKAIKGSIQRIRLRKYSEYEIERCPTYRLFVRESVFRFLKNIVD